MRLAIGAFDEDVMTQFLVEAVVLSLLDGVIGITIGLVVSVQGALALDDPFMPGANITLISFVFSALVWVCCLASCQPAKPRASIPSRPCRS